MNSTVSVPLSYRVAKNSPIEDKLNELVERIFEAGFVDVMQRYTTYLISLAAILPDSNIRLHPNSTANEANLTENLLTFFTYYIYMFGIAIFVFIGEWIHHKYADRVSKYMRMWYTAWWMRMKGNNVRLTNR